MMEMRNLLHAKGKGADSCQSPFTGRVSLVSSRRKEKGTNMFASQGGEAGSEYS